MATFTFTITSTADAAGDTSLGTFDDRGNGSGTLRQAINFANQFAGDPDAEPVPMTVQAGITGTITLTGNLPLVASSIDLDASNLTLDGQGAYRGFLISGISSATGVDAAPTSVNISNLTIQNVRAKGGDSGDFGGGGLGAGGAVFVGPAASVTLTNVNVVTTSALGGDSVYNSRGVGGGGGLGGDGGDGSFQGGTSSGGGGGGILAAGGVGGVYNAGNSNGGGGGGGISSPGEAGSPAGPGRGGKGTNGLGGGGDGGAQAYGGGNAGFGGGGGGGFNNPGGDGGFGGGGGGFGGDGGFGGGGGYELGGGKGGFGGGGALKKLDSVGNPISSQGGFAAGTGGGGGALGGAIFVAAGGTITIAGDSVQTGGSVTGGRNLNVFSSQNNGRASAYGAGIFYEGGSAGATAMLNFGAGNQSYADQIADLNGAAGNTTTDNGLGGVGGIVGLAKTGSGALTLGGVNTYTGGTTIITGTIRVGSDTALGASSGRLTFKSGALNTTAGVTSARAVTIFGSGTLQVDGAATTTLSGDIADGTVQTPETNVTIPGMLIKNGTGTLILSGASTYSGGTMIAAGTLNLSASAILSGTMISMGPAGTGIISFRAAAGQTATLALETAAQPSSGATFAYMLADFGANDVLNLKGFGPSATTSVSYAGGTLTVTNAGTSESFMLTNPEEARYRVSDDGNGGVLINSIDTTAPTRPAAPIVVASSDTGRSSTDGITKDATPTLTGTAEVGARVSLYEGKTFLAAAVAGSNGMYTITSPTLADGKHILNVTATDAAGNVSAISTGRQITIDTAAPARPAQPTLSAASDTGRSSTDGNTRDTTPTFTGTAEAGATISLYEGKTLLATAIASAGGTYAITSPQLADGRHVLNVTATDAAGNVSAISIGRQVTIDTTRPTTPAAPTLAAASDTGTSSSDGITRDTTPTFTGTADAGTTITLYDGTTKVGSATAGSTGSYTVTASTLADGAHSIRVGATDAAGNVSALSPIKRVAIDTMAPATSITNSGGSTSQASQTITGTGEFGTTVTLTDNGMNVGTATVGSKGTWSSQIMLSSGINRIFASDTDKAGNVGKSQTVAFDYKPDSGSRIASLALPSNDAVSPAAHAFASADLTMALFNAVFAPSHVEAAVPDPLPAPDLLAVMGLASPAR